MTSEKDKLENFLRPLRCTRLSGTLYRSCFLDTEARKTEWFSTVRIVALNTVTRVIHVSNNVAVFTIKRPTTVCWLTGISQLECATYVWRTFTV